MQQVWKICFHKHVLWENASGTSQLYHTVLGTGNIHVASSQSGTGNIHVASSQPGTGNIHIASSHPGTGSIHVASSQPGTGKIHVASSQPGAFVHRLASTVTWKLCLSVLIFGYQICEYSITDTCRRVSNPVISCLRDCTVLTQLYLQDLSLFTYVTFHFGLQQQFSENYLRFKRFSQPNHSPDFLITHNF